MKEIAAGLLTLLGRPSSWDAPIGLSHGGWCVGERAFLRFGDRVVIFLAQNGEKMCLGVAALREKYLPENFVGEKEPLPGGAVLLTASCDGKNASALRRHCPKCVPSLPGKGVESILAENEAELPLVRDRMTFAAFADGMQKRYALVGTAKDAAAAARLLDCGATCIVFAPEEKAASPMPEEYRGRRFVLSAHRALEIGEENFPGETLREAEKIAKLAAAKCAAWQLHLPGKISAAEHLVLARELYCRNATPSRVLAAAEQKDLTDHAAIAAMYGKYEFKTV